MLMFSYQFLTGTVAFLGRLEEEAYVTWSGVFLGSLEASSEIHRAFSPVRIECPVPRLLSLGCPCPWPENWYTLEGVSAGWSGRWEAAILGCMLVHSEARSSLKRVELGIQISK